MAGIKVRTDPVTRSKLGESVLSDLREELRAIDCQTCGRPLRRWRRPALAVYADGELANASLHHAGCRPPGWHEGPMAPVSDVPHLTWRAGTFVMPALLTLGAASDGTPFFLVNPSYEAALLQYVDGERGDRERGEDGETSENREDGETPRGWQVWTVEVFKELGLDGGLHTLSPDAVPTRGLTASIADRKVSVTVRSGEVLHHWPDIPLSPETERLARSRGSIVVGVTTLFDIHKPITDLQIGMHVATGEFAVGVAALAGSGGGKGGRRRKT